MIDRMFSSDRCGIILSIMFILSKKQTPERSAVDRRG